MTEVDRVKVARAFAISGQIAKTILEGLKAKREEEEPESARVNQIVDKQLAATVSQIIVAKTGFGV